MVVDDGVSLVQKGVRLGKPLGQPADALAESVSLVGGHLERDAATPGVGVHPDRNTGDEQDATSVPTGIRVLLHGFFSRRVFTVFRRSRIAWRSWKFEVERTSNSPSV